MTPVLLALFVACTAATDSSPASTTSTFFVAIDGSDANDGLSRASAFRTVGHCAAQAPAASIADVECVLGAGTYRESVLLRAYSGAAKTTFRADADADADAGVPTLSGLDLVEGADVEWQRMPSMGGAGSNVWRTRMTLPIGAAPPQQLFMGGSMLHEARWPNVGANFPLSQLAPKHWQNTTTGSRYGTVIAPALAAGSRDASTGANFSWDGARATLNVAHQFYTWTRAVANHSAGSGSFQYAKDLPSIANYASQTKPWEHNMFFLSGKLQALDAPGEFFWDPDGSDGSDGSDGDGGSGGSGGGGGTLYLWPPAGAGDDPSKARVEYKARPYALSATSTSVTNNIHLEGLHFEGATFHLPNCNNCRVSNVQLLYPTYDADIPELYAPAKKGTTASTLLSGAGSSLTNITLLYSNNHGLGVGGTNTTVDNALIAYTDWLGTLTYVPLSLMGNGHSATRCTVAFFGNAGITSGIPNTPANDTQPSKLPPPLPQPMRGRRAEVAHCHIHHGGMVGLDTAALYSGGWHTAGLDWHHNWIHEHREKCVRCDDQSANATVHHNVVFNCGQGDVGGDQRHSGYGLIMKGDGHTMYANTFFDAAHSEMCLPSCPEPLKAFRKQYPLLSNQNNRTIVLNSVARVVEGKPCSCRGNWTGPPGGAQHGIVKNNTLAQLKLADPGGFDFRPAKGSPLIGAGVPYPPFTPPGSAAFDAGAYQHDDAKPWMAGCTHSSLCQYSALMLSHSPPSASTTSAPLATSASASAIPAFPASPFSSSPTSSPSFTNSATSTKYAAFSIVASTNGTLFAGIGQAQKHKGNPLLVQDQPWETRLDNSYPNVSLQLASMPSGCCWGRSDGVVTTRLASWAMFLVESPSPRQLPLRSYPSTFPFTDPPTPTAPLVRQNTLLSLAPRLHSSPASPDRP